MYFKLQSVSWLYLIIISFHSRFGKMLTSDPTLSYHPVVIVVSFDGFRYDYLDRPGAPMPNLQHLKRTGVSVPFLRNQFPTKTFPNHMSIATGLHAESHGVTDNWLYDSKYGRRLVGGDPQFWNFDNQTLPLWTLNELAGEGRRSGVVMWPGCQFPYGVANTLPSRIVKFNDTIPYEDRVDIVISWITDKNPLNLVFLYFEQPDTYGHAFGPESEEVTEEIKRLDKVVGYLVNQLKTLGIYEKINLIFLSDHGFQQVDQDKIINYTSALTPGTFKPFGYSPVIHILPEDGQFENVHSKLVEFSRDKNFTVYRKEELLPEWHFGNNRRIMPIVIVADLGYVFDDFVPEYIDFYNELFNLTASPDRVYGTHGYDNRYSQMHGFFIAHGPAFRVGYEVDVLNNVDVYPLVSRILGIRPAPNNGSETNANRMLL